MPPEASADPLKPNPYLLSAVTFDLYRVETFTARRSPVLPGEPVAPVLPSHGADAPVLPVLPVLPGDPAFAAACYALPVKPAPRRKIATLRALAARVTSPAFAAELTARADLLEAIADGVPIADRVTQRAFDHAPMITR